MPTDSLAAVFAFSFVVGIGAVISPGPVTAAIVSESPRQGWLVGPLVATGHSVLEFVIVILIGIGLSAGMARPEIGTLISLGGGLLLLWMGGSYLWGVAKGRFRLPKPGQASQRRSLWGLMGLGMVTTISNPFWYAWWMTIAAGYLLQAQALGIAAVAMFYLGHISADFTWDTMLSGAVGTGRRWLTDRVYQALILVCGGFMTYLGALFVVAGLRGG